MKAIPSIFQITIIVSIALAFLAIMDVINKTIGLIIVFIFFTGSIVGSALMAKGSKNTKSSHNNTSKLLENQVKFYDLLLKGTAVLLVIAAILLYKDRQDMINTYDKIISEVQLKADSLISDAGIELTQTITYAESLKISLQNATKETKQTLTELMSIKEEVKEELVKLKKVREEESNILFTKKQAESIDLRFAKYRQCKIDKKDLSRDKEFNNSGAIIMNDLEARKMFKKALGINPENKEALFNLGLNYFYGGKEKNLLESIQCFDKLIELYPDDPEGYVCGAQVLIRIKGKEKEAFDYLKQAASRGFDNHRLIMVDFCSQDPIFWQLIPSELRK